MKGRVAGAAEGAERRHHLEGQKARRFEGRRAAGDGRGEGGAAAFMVDICGSTAALGFFRGGVLTSKLVVVSTPSIMHVSVDAVRPLFPESFHSIDQTDDLTVA
jgi:hypothetical protein